MRALAHAQDARDRIVGAVAELDHITVAELTGLLHEVGVRRPTTVLQTA